MGACWSVHGIDSSSASSSRAARFRVAEVLGRFGLVVVLMELPLRFKGFFAVDRVGAYIRQEERCWGENRKKKVTYHRVVVVVLRRVGRYCSEGEG